VWSQLKIKYKKGKRITCEKNHDHVFSGNSLFMTTRSAKIVCLTQKAKNNVKGALNSNFLNLTKNREKILL